MQCTDSSFTLAPAEPFCNSAKHTKVMQQQFSQEIYSHVAGGLSNCLVSRSAMPHLFILSVVMLRISSQEVLLFCLVVGWEPSGQRNVALLVMQSVVYQGHAFCACSGPLPSTIGPSQLQQLATLDIRACGLSHNLSGPPNSRGEFLPEWMSFDRQAWLSFAAISMLYPAFR